MLSDADRTAHKNQHRSQEEHRRTYTVYTVQTVAYTNFGIGKDVAIPIPQQRCAIIHEGEDDVSGFLADTRCYSLRALFWFGANDGYSGGLILLGL